MVGTREALGNALDVVEADRRLDDPANRERIPWERVTADLGV